MIYFKKTCVALALAVSSGLSIGATNLSFNFGTFFVGIGPAAPPTFATLSVTSADDKTFAFDLNILGNLNSVFGSTGTFVKALTINTFSNADPTSNTIAAGTWGVSTIGLKTNPANTGSVNWDFADYFGNSSNFPTTRLTQGEEVKWTTTFASVQSPLFGSPAMILKVQGYGNSSEYTPTSPIPEPETYAMMLAGLGLMGLVARRRKNGMPG